jgi:hypothetical protein
MDNFLFADDTSRTKKELILSGSSDRDRMGSCYRLLTTSVRMRKFNLIMFHFLKHGFPSYVDASRQKSTILNGDARDHDVSTQGALAANIKVITCFTTTNYLAEHYDLPRRDISRNSPVSPHRHTIVR